MEPPPHARRRRRLSSNGVIVHWPATANSTEIPNPRPERRRGCGAAFAGTFELATSLPISGHNDVWKTDRNPPLTGHFPDRRRPDRSGLDTSHKAVFGQCQHRLHVKAHFRRQPRTPGEVPPRSERTRRLPVGRGLAQPAQPLVRRQPAERIARGLTRSPSGARPSARSRTAPHPPPPAPAPAATSATTARRARTPS